MKTLFLSKKFQMAVVATVIGIAAKFGLQLDTETTGLLMSPFIAYIVSQAYVDGKTNSAQIEQQTAQTVAAINNADTSKSSVGQLLKAVEPRPPQPTLAEVNEDTMSR